MGKQLFLGQTKNDFQVESVVKPLLDTLYQCPYPTVRSYLHTI